MKKSVLLLVLGAVGCAFGATIAPFYSGSYTLVDLGPASNVPSAYGGLTLKAGDPNTLLIGGAANAGSGVIDALTVTRGAGNHITGFSGLSSLFSTAPNIDGGLAYGPNGDLFYAAFPSNSIGEIKPGSSSPDKIVTAPVGSSTGTLQFIPAGFAGAGSFVVGSYSTGVFCTAPLTPDGSGTFNVGACTHSATTGGGPEGIIYVPIGSALFPSQSVLISEYSSGRVSAYVIDANGLPIPGSRTDFITGLGGAEGATIDPLTGDFLFSTFGGGSHVFEIQGFAAAAASAPEPSSLLLLSLPLLIFWRRRQPR